MTKRLVTTIALLGTIGSACSANNKIGGEFPGDGGIVCRGSSLSTICPPTWEDAQTMLDCLVSPGLFVSQVSSWLGHSEGLLWRSVSSGGQTSHCLYDPTTHAAVGGWRTSNVADFCNETSNDIYYGVAGPGRDYDPDIGPGPKCPGSSPGRCRKPLAEASCPPTWQEAQVDPYLCTYPPGIVQFGHAAGLLARSMNGGFTAQACYYDPVTFALVGEWAATDVMGNTAMGPRSMFCTATS